jgi:hypothetical protein
MQSPKRWLPQDSPRVAVCDGFECLYLGSSARALQHLLVNHGEISAPSRWGTESLARLSAKDVAKEEGGQAGWAIVCIPLSRFAWPWLRADDHPIVAIQNFRSEVEEDAVVGQLTQNDFNWQDSLRIYGSVLYDAPLCLTPSEAGKDGPSSAPDSQQSREQIAQFLDHHPGWSPELNHDSTVSGFRSPHGKFLLFEEIEHLLDNLPKRRD